MSEPRTIFGPRARAAIWLVAGVSVIATVAATLFGQKVAQPVPTERDSYGAAPLGTRAFVETLEALGMHVLRERRGELGGSAPLVLLEPSSDAIVDGERRQLADTIEERAAHGLGTIVVLPKWSYAYGEASPDPDADDVLSLVLPGATLAHTGAITDPLATRSASGSLGTYALSTPWPQSIQGASAEILLAREDGSAIVARRADGLVVVSDPDLVHNWNVQRADNARLMVDVIRHAGASDTVTIDEVFHGHGERRSLATALGEPRAVMLTAQALFVLLLIVWIGSRRFGPPREIPSLAHGPAESIAVSAFVLAEGRPQATLADAYVREVVAELAERLGAAPGEALREQAAHVDRVAARRGEAAAATALLTRASALSQTDASAPLALARDAHQFRRRMLSRS